MDKGSLIGFIAAVGLIVTAMILAVWPEFGMMTAFLDAPSVLIVLGGTVAATMVSTTMENFVTSLKAMGKAFRPPNVDPMAAIEKIITLANLARKEGILALEEAAKTMDDTFLEKGIMLIVDGTDPELVRSILETEIAYIEGRHAAVRSTYDFMALMAPAFGMSGTVIGLIVMLQRMDDPSAIGGAMAVAVITTLYGSMVANVVCLPVSSKLKTFSAEEMLMKEVLIEGMLSIQAGENPRIIEEKLKAFLSPKMRNAGAPEGGAATAEE
ncbi:MAG: MotA/TolQ/ExbB proton channel family protein [Defluviitaleaceae bacterium]|nr:MotA/TolQ/ExbB proton channel family protein [Defluviitaleaceae bacterium]